MNATSSIIFLVVYLQQFLRYLFYLGITGQRFTRLYVCGYCERDINSNRLMIFPYSTERNGC